MFGRARARVENTGRLDHAKRFDIVRFTVHPL